MVSKIFIRCFLPLYLYHVGFIIKTTHSNFYESDSQMSVCKKVNECWKRGMIMRSVSSTWCHGGDRDELKRQKINMRRISRQGDSYLTFHQN